MAQIEGGFELSWARDPRARRRYGDVHPDVVLLTERVVESVRALNARLGWIDDPGALDGAVRDTVSFQLHHARRQHPADWLEIGLDNAFEQLQPRLAEDTTEPWPQRAADHPPGQRDSAVPHVEIDGDVARIAFYGPDGAGFALDPIRLPATS